MYNIKQAAARAGVSVPVLRAWERRYRIVEPDRTPSGYRRFDDASVARIRTMRTLVEEGWSPSAAAAAILAGTVAVSDELNATGAMRSRPAAGLVTPAATVGRDGAAEAADLTGRLIAAARDLQPDAVDEVLDDLFAHGSFERVVMDLLFPALEALGEAWAAGTVTIAGEHMASGAIMRRLGQALEAAGGRDNRPGRVVVGLPPGGRHELGALAFATAARRTGLPVTYLGPDLPPADWLVATTGAAAAVLGVVTPRDRKAALEVAERLRATHPALLVAVGGPAAPTAKGLLRLPPRLAESVATLAAALERRREEVRA